MGRLADHALSRAPQGEPSATAAWCASIPRSAPAAPSARFRCTARPSSSRAGKGEFTWSYDPGQCTFCGRCVEGCKDHALSQDSSLPADLSDHRRVEEVLHRCPQAARAKPAAAAPARRSCASGQPCHWRHNDAHMTLLETIPEKLGITEPWVEKGGVHWLAPGALNVRELATGDERASRPLHHHHRLSIARRRGLSPGVSLGPRRPVARLSLSVSPAIPSKASTIFARPWTGSSARFTKGLPSTLLGREYEPLLLRQGDTAGREPARR